MRGQVHRIWNFCNAMIYPVYHHHLPCKNPLLHCKLFLFNDTEAVIFDSKINFHFQTFGEDRFYDQA